MAELKTYELEQLGEPLFESRSSQVYQTEDPDKLLKLFRENRVPKELIDNEIINTFETFEKGISKVECFGPVQVGNRFGFIMKKVEGATLIGTLSKKPSILFEASSIMCDLSLKMHATHTDKIRSYKDVVKDTLLNAPALSFLSEEEKNKCLIKLDNLPDGDSIIHLDYHPDNVMTNNGDSTIIDWMTACCAVPEADIAATRCLLNECEMIPGITGVVANIFSFLAKKIYESYFKKYSKATGIKVSDIEPWRLPFMIFRLGIWTIDSEIEMWQREIRKAINQ